MELFKQYFVPWIISNSIAIIFLVAALWRPKLARLLFVLLFAWACWVNYTNAQNNPEIYLGYAALTPFSFYRDFINGWFKEHIAMMVTLIAFGQLCIAIGMLFNGWWVKLACIGAIVFQMSIAPLGIGSGFPCTILGSLAAYFILKKDDFNYLWNFKKVKQ